MIRNLIAFRTAISRLMAHSIAVSFALLWATVVPARAADDAKCAKRLVEVASINLVEGTGGTLLVPVKIDGTDRMLLLVPDGLTAITQKVVDKIGRVTGPDPLRTVMFDQTMSSIVNASIDLGRIHGDSISLSVMPEGPYPDPSADGVLGDLLQEYDIELDFKALKLNLFRPDHCPGMGVYWSKTAAALPMIINRIRNISVSMQLDGKDVQVGLSFFNPRALMGFDVAGELFGLKPDSPGVTLTENYLHSKIAPVTSHYVFKTLNVDGMQINNLGVDLYKLPDTRPFRPGCPHPMCYGGENDFSLGLSEVRQFHLYFAFKEQMLYLTPAGAYDAPVPAPH